MCMLYTYYLSQTSNAGKDAVVRRISVCIHRYNNYLEIRRESLTTEFNYLLNHPPILHH